MSSGLISREPQCGERLDREDWEHIVPTLLFLFAGLTDGALPFEQSKAGKQHKVGTVRGVAKTRTVADVTQTDAEKAETLCCIQLLSPSLEWRAYRGYGGVDAACHLGCFCKTEVFENITPHQNRGKN